MTDNPYTTPDSDSTVAPDLKSSSVQAAANGDLSGTRRAVLYLALASAAMAAFYGCQFVGVVWFVSTGYFQDMSTASVTAIVLDRAVWRGILAFMHAVIALRLRVYAKELVAAQTSSVFNAERIFVAARRAWQAIVTWVIVIVVWKSAMFVLFGFLFRNWAV
jgi:hypothetical protein